MSLEQMGSDRVDVGYTQPRKLLGRARKAPAKAPPRGHRTMFLDIWEMLRRILFRTCFPHRKHVLIICLGKCSGQVFRDTGFYVLGR